MEIKIRIETTDNEKLKFISENFGKSLPKRDKIETIKIGSFCSECTNPTEKVMRSCIFDVENIVFAGMYEKAQIATEVLMERYDNPIETALNKVIPAVDAVIEDFRNKLKTKVELIKSLQAADIAMSVLEASEDKRWNKTRCGNWEKFLKETVEDCCEFLLP